MACISRTFNIGVYLGDRGREKKCEGIHYNKDVENTCMSFFVICHRKSPRCFNTEVEGSHVCVEGGHVCVEGGRPCSLWASFPLVYKLGYASCLSHMLLNSDRRATRQEVNNRATTNILDEPYLS